MCVHEKTKVKEKEAGVGPLKKKFAMSGVIRGVLVKRL